ncbi:MAG: glycosyltransferase family 4 protein, partial [Planctomycetes bacterium]|nr:glycosyltransferase family 4 protein [Planctomycetota bacterium]
MTKRILHLLSQRPAWTGSGVALEAIVDLAAHAGWNQRVVVGTPSDDPTPPVGSLPGCYVFPLLFGESDLAFPLPGMSDVMPYPSSRFSALTTGPLAAYRDGWRRHLADVLSRFSPDVIHTHHLWLLSAMVKDVAPDVPVVTHCHATGLRQRELCPHLADEVRRGCLRNDRFIVLHNGDARRLEKELGIDRGKIRVVGSGFRQETFHHRGRVKQPGPVIVYAGKLSNAKGVPALISAVERLAVRMPNLVLHVAGSGSGDEAAAIEEQMRSSLARIIFHGQLKQQQLAELCRSAALFVLPSFYEGLPLVLVEAAACGCRLAATALPGIVEELVPVLGDLLQLVPLPAMETIDRPRADAMPGFIDALERAIEVSLQKPPV